MNDEQKLINQTMSLKEVEQTFFVSSHQFWIIKTNAPKNKKKQTNKTTWCISMSVQFGIFSSMLDGLVCRETYSIISKWYYAGRVRSLKWFYPGDFIKNKKKKNKIKTKTAAARVNTGDEEGDKNVMSSILYHTKRVNIIITIKTEIGEASQ